MFGMFTVQLWNVTASGSLIVIGTESSFLIMDFAKHIMDLSLKGKLFAHSVIATFYRCIV